jgi:hypothetical protein
MHIPHLLSRGDCVRSKLWISRECLIFGKRISEKNELFKTYLTRNNVGKICYCNKHYDSLLTPYQLEAGRDNLKQYVALKVWYDTQLCKYTNTFNALPTERKFVLDEDRRRWELQLLREYPLLKHPLLIRHKSELSSMITNDEYEGEYVTAYFFEAMLTFRFYRVHIQIKTFPIPIIIPLRRRMIDHLMKPYLFDCTTITGQKVPILAIIVITMNTGSSF